ncbi:MAG: transcriptional regulator [Flavobacterium sp.]|uniref:DJ-1/PfpI family protein n=1 Tax=Flavobacterium sp. TaxID=239 RepID=UPI000C4573A4|nr:DJ-1/PfpI family protein [Flavobacterium sp.]MBF03186.1 transcriptional regulator [Flavobacterium sp.]|tara:strand:- start:1478 stop:2167 length:690 start_codon:yes stop_codon:yes gene_type:complete
MTSTTSKEPFIIAIPVYDGVDYMDIAAPREIFGWLAKDPSFEREVKIYYVCGNQPTFTTINGVKIAVEATFDDAFVQKPHLIWVPGGDAAVLAAIIADKESSFTAYVTQAGSQAEWVCSVCEGAVLLANTGLLNGHTITTHWAFVNCFGKYPEVTVAEGHPRYVKSGNRVTGGGISSGLDEALYLVELIAGKESAISVQRTLQYYPKPPVHSVIPEAGSCPVFNLVTGK